MKMRNSWMQGIQGIGLTVGLAAVMALAPSQSRAQAEMLERRTGPVVVRRLTVSGRGEVKMKPDKADITLGVVTEDRSSKTAAGANAAASQKVQDALTRLGIAPTDIRTTQYSVQPIYSQTPIRPDAAPRPPVLTGYRVTNQVRVTVHALARLGDILDEATAVGANSIESIAFGQTDQVAAEDQALSKAVTDARRKADLMTRISGVKIVGVYEVNEGNVQRPGPIMYSRASLAATPISPGESTITADVTIVYEIRDLTPASHAQGK
jgi:uncharacterized protein YggE